MNHTLRLLSLLRNAPRNAWAMAPVLALTSVGVMACADAPKTPSGSLVLTFQSDMQLPKDIDSVTLLVRQNGKQLYQKTFNVGPNGVHLPGTLVLTRQEASSSPVSIRVVGWHGPSAKVLRDITTTIPERRNAILQVPLSWLCWDSAKQQGAAQDKSAEKLLSTCGEDSTCQAGACTSIQVASAQLPDYAAENVFGGASGPDQGGACFDTVKCFSTGWSTPLNLTDCSFVKPAGTDSFSVAIVRKPKTAGICGPDSCLIPLNANSEQGWQLAEQRVTLPPRVCELVRDDPDTLGVAVTSACDPKTEQLPTCGPWSSANASPGDFSSHGPDAGLDGSPLDDADITDAGNDVTDAGNDVTDAAADVTDAAQDTGPTCPQGNGLYCGDGTSGTEDALYSCTDGTYKQVNTCGVLGCELNPQGDDRCKVKLQALAAGANYACGLRVDGVTKCWGRNHRGQLADGTATDRSVPVFAHKLTGVSKLSANRLVGCAVHSDGKLECWGSNANGVMGTGFTGSQSSEPVSIGTMVASDVSVGGKHACYVKASDGTVYCWGNNDWGQLGDGSSSPNSLTPVQVTGLDSISAITSGLGFTCAMKPSSNVYCWGNNQFGQLGNSGQNSNIPVQVTGLSGAQALAAGGDFVCLLDTKGIVSCWGNNTYGQLGDGTINKHAAPAPVKLNLGGKKVVGIAAGVYSACAVLNDGSVQCWGANKDGVLGNGQVATAVPTPVVAQVSDVKSVAIGEFFACALLNDGRAKCWGNNAYGQLGIGNTDGPKLVPQWLIQP